MRWHETLFRSPLILAGTLLVAAGCSSTPDRNDDISASEASVVEGRTKIAPVVECVDEVHSPGLSYVAHFGYTNSGTTTVNAPVGQFNSFSPAPADRGQTTSFLPGAHQDAVQVPFDGSPLTWTLGLKTATASKSTPRCQPTTGCPASCDDGNPCTADSCSANTNFACVHTPSADGTSCTDGNACTQADTCQAGVCTAGSPVVCMAADQCHAAGVCNPGTGVCSNPPVANGTACDDGSACTQADSCQAGVCAGGSPVVCVAADACHSAGVCNPGTGVCSSPVVADGTSCGDGNACNGAEVCQQGTCAAGTPVTCTASDQCHAAGVCNPGTGMCSNPPVANGTSCSDGSACTQGDSCQAGVCAGAPVVCTAADACHSAGVCNPGTGVCSSPVLPNGTSCGDGNACNGAEVCQQGTCTGGTPVVCAAPDQCHTAGACNPATGACSNPPVADGTSCSDGSACTQSDTCQAGVCSAGTTVTCTASDSCHAPGVCNPTSGVCSNPVLANGTSCSDGNPCNGVEVCQQGSCTAGAPAACTASDQCHAAGVCDPTTGACSNPPLADGSACNDSNACTQADSCQAGVCQGSNPVSCTASDSCHAAGTCNPTTGVCSNPAAPDGTTCTDGNACTQVDACTAGVCQGSSPVTCPAAGQCNGAGTCNPGTGMCSTPTFPDGTACTDSNGCTQNDSCQSGVCQGGTAVTCTASDSCHVAGVCTPATGTCSNPAAPDGTACTDANACTQNDVCTLGVCTAGAPVVCTTGTCDPTTGTCPVAPPPSCPVQAFARSFDTPLVGNVALDPAGSLYLTGGFATTVDFGTGPLNTAGGTDIYITKLNPTTGVASYAMSFGDSADQNGVNITANAAGQFAVTGTYIGTLAFGGSAPTLSSAADSVFVAGFNAATGSALWAKNIDLGGGALLGITTDPTDNGVVVAGFAGPGASADFGSGPLASGGGRDIVVAKFAAATGTLVWAKQYGGTLDQRGLAVAAGAAGIFVTGQYAGTVNFGNGALPNAAGAKRNIFVANLNNATGVGIASRSIASVGPQQQTAVAIAVDTTGDVILGGSMAGMVDFGAGFVLTSAGGTDAFAAKLAPDLSTVWAARFGDTATQNTTGVALDSAGNVVVSGSFLGTIDASPAGTLTSAGAFDAFVLKLDVATGAPICARNAGDTADQTAARVAVNPVTDSEFVLGTFLSSIDWGGGPLTGTLSSAQTYLVKLQ